MKRQDKNSVKELFLRLSDIAIKYGDVENICNGNIGNQPASEADIKLVEQRLNVVLPEDYKILIRATNGYMAPTYTEPSFLPVQEIDYLRNIDAFLIEAYSIEGLEDTGEALKHSILIGGKDEEQHFLLIPPDSKNMQWRYWKFANWIPGEEAYAGLVPYIQAVIDCVLDMNEEE